MKIHITTSECKNRIHPLRNTLAKNHEVTTNESLDEIPMADIWLVDYYKTYWNKLLERMNSHEEQFLKFKGKLLPISLDDGCVITTEGLKETIVRRFDGWITGSVYGPEKKRYHECLTGKFILIPRFQIYRMDMKIPSIKINQMVFVGSTTGGLKFHGKNIRVEALRLIYTNPFLKNHFKGGLINDFIYWCNPSEEYLNVLRQYLVPQMQHKDWWELLNQSTLCPNLEGNGLFSYRPLESLRSKATIISPPFFLDPGEWLFSDKLKNCVYFYKQDLTDFEKICETAIKDVDKTKSMAEESFDVYKTYFESEPDYTYNKAVMTQFKEKFEQLTGLKI